METDRQSQCECKDHTGGDVENPSERTQEEELDFLSFGAATSVFVFLPVQKERKLEDFF